MSLVTGMGNLSGNVSEVTLGKLRNSSGSTFSKPSNNLSACTDRFALMLFNISVRTGSSPPYCPGLLKRLHVIPGTSDFTPLELRTDLARATSSPDISAIRFTKSLLSRTTPSTESVVANLETCSLTRKASLSSSSDLLSSISQPKASVRFNTLIHFMQQVTLKSNPIFFLLSLLSIKRQCFSLPIKKRRCLLLMSSLGNVVL